MQTAEDQRPITRFGRYELLFRLAAGGMAQVHVGRFSGVQGFEKLLAIKQIHEHLAEDPEFIELFLDEARLAARLSHPNVVQVIELGKYEGAYYIAMEYVAGESLTALLRRTKPGYRMGARVVADAAAGLHAAHGLRDANGNLLNVVHRDVSPQNILISYSGVVKVTDFGVARARDSVHVSEGGSLKGKFSYMSPEQALGKAVDHRSDVFALGIVLYEVTTYRRLFKAVSSTETLKLVAAAEVEPPNSLLGDYPKRLEQIVMTALAREPDLRYQSAEEMQHELERYLATSGELVLPSHLGTLMTRTFADRIAEKSEALFRAQRVFSPEVLDLSSNTSLTLDERPPRAPGRRRRALRLALPIAALAVALGGGFGAWLMLRDSRHHGAAAARSPREVQIQVRTDPAGATIEAEGKVLSNPLKLTRPAAAGVMTLVVSAPGFQRRTMRIPLSEDGRYYIGLNRMLPDAAPVVAAKPVDASPAPAKRQPKRTRGARGRRKNKKSGAATDEEEGLYGNPFNQ